MEVLERSETMNLQERSAPQTWTLRNPVKRKIKKRNKFLRFIKCKTAISVKSTATVAVTFLHQNHQHYHPGKSRLCDSSPGTEAASTARALKTTSSFSPDRLSAKKTNHPLITQSPHSRPSENVPSLTEGNVFGRCAKTTHTLIRKAYAKQDTFFWI